VGVLRAEFDASALTLSRLNATRLIVRFADGTLIDTELADILPPVRDVSDVMQDSVEVLLALPLLSASGNLDDGRGERPPAPLAREQVTVQELAGHERSELAVLRHALTASLHRGKCSLSHLPGSASGARRPGSGSLTRNSSRRCCRWRQARRWSASWASCYIACRPDADA
jgi:predicted component of type VI protein secretion system